MRLEDRVVNSKSVCQKRGIEGGVLPVHDLHRAHPHPPRSKVTSASFAINEFGEHCEDELGLCLELGRELVEQE